jgi:hypothetical protein
MKNHSSHCPLCAKVIGIDKGQIVVLNFLQYNNQIEWIQCDCDHSKNGYCAIFRAQAVLDKIEFNMHGRSCEK